MLDRGFILIFLRSLQDIALYTARVEVLSTRFLLLYLALLNQAVSAEARKHEVVGEDASLNVDLSDTVLCTQTQGRTVVS